MKEKRNSDSQKDMSDFAFFIQYLERTGQTLHEMLLPLSNYEFAEIIALMKQAEQKKQKLIFYFDSPEHEKAKRYSHRFE